MQIKTTMKCHFTPARMAIIKKTGNNNIGEDMKKLEPSYTADGNVKWCSRPGKEFGSSSEWIDNLCLHKILQMFIVALFIIAPK